MPSEASTTATAREPGADRGAPQLEGWIHSHGLTRAFGKHVALHPTELSIGPGRVTGLLGPNGSGKSTFMRLLVGLVRPDAGRATLDGVALAGDGTAVRRRATYVPGEMHLYGELRGAAHLEWLLRGRPRAAWRRSFELAADALGLPLEQRVRGYSHGMKRQLLFAAAMGPDVRVRILDEPTEGLDPTRRGAVLDLLEQDVAEGRTLLLSSHHLSEVDRVCGRMLFLSEGRVVADEESSVVSERMARLLRISWPAGTGIETRLEGLLGTGERVLRSEDERLTIELSERDPRAFLQRLVQRGDLPAPTRIEHGALSLQELYREVYGVEGC